MHAMLTLPHCTEVDISKVPELLPHDLAMPSKNVTFAKQEIMQLYLGKISCAKGSCILNLMASIDLNWKSVYFNVMSVFSMINSLYKL